MTDEKKAEEVKKEVPEKVYTLTESEMSKLVNDSFKEKSRGLERELNLGNWEEVEDPKTANKTAKMKLHQKDGVSPWGVIVDWVFLKNEYDEKTRAHDKAIYKITVMYDDGERADFDISLMDFAHIDSYETVEIIKSKVKRLKKIHGQVAQTKRSKEGYAMSPHLRGGIDRRPEHIGADMVDLEEVRMDTTVTIKRPNGQEVTLNSSRLNA